MTTPLRIAFIGLGRIGGRIARNLLRDGHEVVGYDVRRAAVDELVRDGGHAADTVTAAVSGATVVFSSLPGPAEVEEAALGASGVRAAARPGLTYIEISTCGPRTIGEIDTALRPFGVEVLDAPITGGTAAAENRDLTFLVGADPASFERWRPLLSTLGKTIIHVGPVSSGNVAKLINNVVSAGISSVTAEGMVLGAKAGLRPRTVYEVLAAGTASSDVLRSRYPSRILKGRFEPTFTIDLALKDLSLALELGRDAGMELPFGQMAFEFYAAARARGLGGADLSATIVPLEEKMGVHVRD